MLISKSYLLVNDPLSLSLSLENAGNKGGGERGCFSFSLLSLSLVHGPFGGHTAIILP